MPLPPSVAQCASSGAAILCWPWKARKCGPGVESQAICKAMVTRSPGPLGAARPCHDVEVVDLEAMRCVAGMVAARDQSHVAVLHRHQLVKGAVVGIRTVIRRRCWRFRRFWASLSCLDHLDPLRRLARRPAGKSHAPQNAGCGSRRRPRGPPPRRHQCRADQRLAFAIQQPVEWDQMRHPVRPRPSPRRRSPPPRRLQEDQPPAAGRLARLPAGGETHADAEVGAGP